MTAARSRSSSRQGKGSQLPVFLLRSHPCSGPVSSPRRTRTGSIDPPGSSAPPRNACNPPGASACPQAARPSLAPLPAPEPLALPLPPCLQFDLEALWSLYAICTLLYDPFPGYSCPVDPKAGPQGLTFPQVEEVVMTCALMQQGGRDAASETYESASNGEGCLATASFQPQVLLLLLEL